MKIAVLGCGSIGRRHLQNLQKMSEIELLAFDPGWSAAAILEGPLTDVPLARAESLVWEWQPDVVVVCAPTQEHLRVALEAAQRGCHLFLEKPLSHSLEGVAELQAEIQARGLVSMVGCNLRFHPGHQAIHDLLLRNAVGEVLGARLQCGSYLPGWRPQDYRASYSASPQWGGAILDCIHELDLALWHLGAAVLVGAAHIPARVLELETDGLCEMILRHDSGAISNVHLNFVQRDYRRTCQIIGSQGTLEWNFVRGDVQHFGPQGDLVQTIAQPADWNGNQMYEDEIEAFLDAVRGGWAAPNPVSEAARTLELALQVRQVGAEVEIGR